MVTSGATYAAAVATGRSSGFVRFHYDLESEARLAMTNDVVERMMPYWYDGIIPDLQTGKTVLVAAHGNSLRALVKQ